MKQKAAQPEQYDFFAFLSRMRYISRWGLMRNTVPENIQEHSLDVAVIAHALAVIRNTYFNGTLDAGRVALYRHLSRCQRDLYRRHADTGQALQPRFQAVIPPVGRPCPPQAAGHAAARIVTGIRAAVLFRR